VSFDTKYRPLRYADVLGQEATIKVCKEVVRQGVGFHQSYVFAGGHGGGKTTCGRIFARAILCENPQDGESCDACQSCTAMLADKSENFMEVDAATNSGKDHVRRITEEAMFGSFSGKRKIYLFDESHELSRQAMDAMLKPLEDNIRGSQEKQLVCIFCTTEPEKMRPAIMSRCAPAFKIRPNTPEEIGERLAYICEQEGIEYDAEVLPVVAEVVECHVRDAIKAVEGVAMLGRVDQANVASYLHMDANALYLDLLETLGFDLPRALAVIEDLNMKVSPATCYERMADVCMLAYRLVNLGTAAVPSYWDRDRLVAAGERHKEFLVEFAQRFAGRPYHATSSMFACDVSLLHQKRAGIVVVAEQSTVTVPSAVPASGQPATVPATATATAPTAPAQPISRSESPAAEEISPPPIKPSPEKTAATAATSEKPAQSVGSMRADPFVNEMGVHINPQAQTHGRGTSSQPIALGASLSALTPAVFTDILHRRVIELTEEKSTSGRPARRDDMGSS
jgi:DNA polymerase-3 subunit gamma/tau